MADLNKLTTAEMVARIELLEHQLNLHGIYEIRCQCCANLFWGEAEACRCGGCCNGCILPKGSKIWVKGKFCPSKRVAATDMQT